MWDVKTGEPYVAPLLADTSPVEHVRFSPDGQTLVSSHLRSAVVWNMSGEQAIGEPIDGPGEVTTDVSFSPDGKRLVAGRFDGTTVVDDTGTRRQALRIDGGSVVTAVAFHPDGNVIAVGTIEGKVRLFDAESGTALGSPLDGGRSPVWQLAFSPDGKLLAVAGVETRAMLWDVDPAVWRQRACAIVGRNLTREEWNLHLPSGAQYRATCSEWPTP